MAICEPQEAICEAEDARPVMEEPQSVGSSKMSGQWLINCLLRNGLLDVFPVGLKKTLKYEISSMNHSYIKVTYRAT